MHRTPERNGEAGTRALLDALADGAPEDQLLLGDLLQGLGKRAFGVLLFLAIPPAFIPGVAGVISSPIVLLIGLQLLGGRKRPWLPRWLANRGPHRHTIQRFDNVFAPWLARMETLIKPRWPGILDHPLAGLVTGLLLVLLGVLLALPIPFTNALFGGLLLLYALAYLERDGALLVVAWLSGAAAVTVFGLLSGTLAEAIAPWVDRLV